MRDKPSKRKSDRDAAAPPETKRPRLSKKNQAIRQESDYIQRALGEKPFMPISALISLRKLKRHNLLDRYLIQSDYAVFVWSMMNCDERMLEFLLSEASFGLQLTMVNQNNYATITLFLNSMAKYPLDVYRRNSDRICKIFVKLLQVDDAVIIKGVLTCLDNAVNNVQKAGMAKETIVALRCDVKKQLANNTSLSSHQSPAAFFSPPNVSVTQLKQPLAEIKQPVKKVVTFDDTPRQK